MEHMEHTASMMEDGRGFKSVCVRLWRENKVAVLCAVIILVFALNWSCKYLFQYLLYMLPSSVTERSST